MIYILIGVALVLTLPILFIAFLVLFVPTGQTHSLEELEEQFYRNQIPYDVS